MPLYEYECRRTGRRFEAIQKFSDAPLTQCPECDAHPDCLGEVRRLLSAPAIQFKGEGWYVTDYAGKGKAGAEEKGERSKKNGDSGGDKGDSKPASASTSEKSDKKKD